MNDIERAIGIFEERIAYDKEILTEEKSDFGKFVSERHEADKLAIKALNEQIERAKGCECCEGLENGIGFIKCPTKDFTLDVKYCTECGRKIGELDG